MLRCATLAMQPLSARMMPLMPLQRAMLPISCRDMLMRAP